MNLLWIAVGLGALSLVVLVFFIFQTKAHWDSETEASAEAARQRQEESDALGRRTIQLAARLQKMTDEVANAMNAETLDALEGRAQALIGEAVSVGVTEWQGLTTGSSGFCRAVGQRRKTLAAKAEAEAEALATAARKEAENQAALNRVARLEGLISKVEEASKRLDQCEGLEDEVSLQAEVERILSAWVPQSDEESKALEGAFAVFQGRLNGRRISRRQEGIRRYQEAANRLIGEHRHAEAVALLLGLWRQEPENSRLFGQYLKAAIQGAEETATEEATRLLVDAEAALREFRPLAKPQDVDDSRDYQGMVFAAKQSLQDRIQTQRKAAFSEVLGLLPGLGVRGASARTHAELVSLQDEAEGILRQWGLLSVEESKAWKQAHDLLIKGLLDRDRVLAEEESQQKRREATAAALKDVQELENKITNVIREAGQAKGLKALKQIMETVSKWRQPNLEELSAEKQDALAALTREMQDALQTAESRILGELRSNYNQVAVQGIESFLERLTVENNRKVSALPTLVGTFALIDTAQLEPAIQQYYQVAVARAIELLDDETLTKFMQRIAQTGKSGLEE